MCIPTAVNQPPRAASYPRLPLTDLIQLIVHHRDPAALYELHEHRTVFRDHDGPPLRLVEYLDRLRHNPAAWSWAGRDANVLDRAYDLTNDKFRNLPARAQPAQSHELQSKRTGPDCRHYFRAFLDYVARHLDGTEGPIRSEVFSAHHLQVFVYRHFLLSCLECARRSRRVGKRFFWEVRGGRICIKMPFGMDNSQCRAWLEANVDAPDPLRPGERRRVQWIVDERLGKPRRLRFGESLAKNSSLLMDCGAATWSLQYDLSTRGLAEAVANEKVQNLDKQRPAIRKLGPQQLGGMIRRIFGDLIAGDYTDIAVARDFSLSKPTFSRFAGSRWDRSSARAAGIKIPDLWQNTAQVLAGNPVFVEAAKASGIWDTVDHIVNSSPVREIESSEDPEVDDDVLCISPEDVIH